MSDKRTEDEIANAVIARIDTPDELYITALREYLEQNGCHVYVNESAPDFSLYHIICGDLDFVKKILADNKTSHEKTLAIVWGGTKREVESLVHTHHIKAWVTHEKSLDSRAARDIFAFFFMSDQLINVADGDWEEKLEELQIHEDKKRIAQSMDSIFEKKQQIHEEKHRTPKSTSPLIFVCIGLLGLIFLPMIWYITTIGISVGSLYYGAIAAREGNSNRVRTFSALGEEWVNRSSNALSYARVPIRLFLGEDTVLGQEHMLSLLDNVAVALRETRNLLEEGRRVSLLLLTQDSGETSSPASPAIALQKLGTSLSSVENNLGLAQAELTRLLAEQPFPFSIPAVSQFGIKALGKLSGFHTSMTNVGNALTLYPEIAGFKEKKTYLLLFQNSMELRPTGGFIGSIGIVSFSDGRRNDLSVQDVYTVDGQLKGHVDPPAPIRDILGQEHWYLRDSNWEPDFAKSGARAAWFYEKETGTTVDGVIGISTPLVIQLLKITGPLDLSDYNDRITAENFFGKSLFYSQTDFFPGSTQKKDFLGTLTSNLLTKLTTSKTISPASLFSTITQAFQSGDVLLYFNEGKIEDLVSHFGWGGRVPLALGCQGQAACVFDPVSLVEANLGVNKANYYLEKSVLQQIHLGEDGSADESILLDIRNTSAAGRPAPGSGPYKAYIRFFVPAGGILGPITLDGIPLSQRDSKKKVIPDLPYWEKETSTEGTTVVGVALVVGLGEEKKLSVSYKRPNLVRFDGNKAALELAFQKQPGVTGVALTTEITFPIFWTSRAISGGGMLSFLAKEAKLTYNSTLGQNQVIRLEFQK